MSSDSDLFCLNEEDVIRIIQGYLQSKGLLMSMNMLEHETGIINGRYSDEVTKLRRLVLDGMWAEAVQYVHSLPLTEESAKFVLYHISKQKYMEFVFICSEMDLEASKFLGTEIVNSVEELYKYCPCPVEYDNLRDLLTITNLFDSPEYENWDLQSSRMQCFHEICGILEDMYGIPSGFIAVPERLIDLFTKGVLYESCEEFCELKGSKKSETVEEIKIGELIKDSSSIGSDLGLYSWLQSVPWVSLRHRFLQHHLRVELEELVKPDIRYLWEDAVLHSLSKPNRVIDIELMRKPSWEDVRDLTRMKTANEKLCPGKVATEDTVMTDREMSSTLYDKSTSFAEKIKPETQNSDLEAMKNQFWDELPQISVKLASESNGQNDSIFSPVIRDETSLSLTPSREDNVLSQSASSFHESNIDITATDDTEMEMNIELNYDYGYPTKDSGSNCCSPKICSESPDYINTEKNISPTILLTETVKNGDVVAEDNYTSFSPAIESNYPDSNFNSNVCSEVSISNVPRGDSSETHQEIQPNRSNTSIVSKSVKANVADKICEKNSVLEILRSKEKLRESLLRIITDDVTKDPEECNIQENKQFLLDAEVEPNVLNLSDDAEYQIPKPFFVTSPLLRNGQHLLNRVFLNDNRNEDISSKNEAVDKVVEASTAVKSPMLKASSNPGARSHSTKRTRRNETTKCCLSGSSQASGSNESSDSRQNFIAVTQLEDEQAVRSVEFHPSGKFYAVGSNTKTLRICAYPNCKDIRSDHEPREPTVLYKRQKHHKGSIYCMAWNATGDLLATGSNDKTVKLMKFNQATFQMEDIAHPLTMHGGTVRDMCFMEDVSNRSNLLISGGSGDNKIYVTDCETAMPFQSLTGHTGQILSLYTWGGVMFVSSSQDKTIRFWDMRTRGCVNLIPARPAGGTGPGSAAATVSVDPSGRLLVSGHEDASCMLYDMKGSRILQTFKPHTADVRTARLSPKAFYLLTGSYDCKLMLTDLQGDLTQPLSSVRVAEHVDKVIQGRWHPQEFTFLSTSADKTATLWALPPT